MKSSGVCMLLMTLLVVLLQWVIGQSLVGAGWLPQPRRDFNAPKG